MSLPIDWFEADESQARLELLKTATPEYMSGQIQLLHSTIYPQGQEACLYVRNNWDEEKILTLSESAQGIYAGIKAEWDKPEEVKELERLRKVWFDLLVNNPIQDWIFLHHGKPSLYWFAGKHKHNFKLDFCGGNSFHSVHIVDEEGNIRKSNKSDEYGYVRNMTVIEWLEEYVENHPDEFKLEDSRSCGLRQHWYLREIEKRQKKVQEVVDIANEYTLSTTEWLRDDEDKKAIPMSYAQWQELYKKSNKKMKKVLADSHPKFLGHQEYEEREVQRKALRKEHRSCGVMAFTMFPSTSKDDEGNSEVNDGRL